MFNTQSAILKTKIINDPLFIPNIEGNNDYIGR